ncbi:MAG: dimethylarginine dimethylaminohydrolase family protein, partial [Planctomycetota bacterium]
GKALELIDAENCGQWLFDFPPDVGRFTDEHDRYRELLAGLGVEVHELSDYLTDGHEAIDRLPNLTYLHDTAVVSSHGAIVSQMAGPARRGEGRLVRQAFDRMGVPILAEFDHPEDAFEGCLLLSPETLLVADTERHTRATIDKFIPTALAHFAEVLCVEVPKARRYMHPDTIYNRVGRDLALAYLPAFRSTVRYTADGSEPVDFLEHMRGKGVEIIGVSDAEQRRLACSFVPLAPGVMVHYDTALDASTQRELARRGVELILFHPDALVAGGGSLRCLTLRLHREPTA